MRGELLPVRAEFVPVREELLPVRAQRVPVREELHPVCEELPPMSVQLRDVLYSCWMIKPQKHTIRIEIKILHDSLGNK